MNYLIYINGMGPNYKGDNIYEFIFSDTLEVLGENWESKPANGYPSPPDMEYIKKVGTLINEEIAFDLVQNSDVFSVIDSMDGVLALGWEKENDEDYFPDDEFPIYLAPCYLRDGTVWPKGDAELLIPANDLANEIDDQMIDRKSVV